MDEIDLTSYFTKRWLIFWAALYLLFSVVAGWMFMDYLQTASWGLIFAGYIALNCAYLITCFFIFIFHSAHTTK